MTKININGINRDMTSEEQAEYDARKVTITEEQMKLQTIKDMRDRFNCEVGFSDHTIGFNAAIGAVHYGASFIEKHICLKNISPNFKDLDKEKR